MSRRVRCIDILIIEFSNFFFVWFVCLFLFILCFALFFFYLFIYFGGNAYFHRGLFGDLYSFFVVEKADVIIFLIIILHLLKMRMIIQIYDILLVFNKLFLRNALKYMAISICNIRVLVKLVSKT